MPGDSSSRRAGATSSGRSGYDAGSYHTSASGDPRSDRYARRGGSRHERSRRGGHDDDALGESQFPRDTAKREAKTISRWGITRDQSFSTTPCTGALYVIMTLVVFWFAGIVYGVVIFTKTCRQVGSVEDVENLRDAIDLIWRDKKAQGALVVLATFVGSMAFMWLYLGVVVLYMTIINNKKPYSWMKESEARNEKDREVFKARQRAKAKRAKEAYDVNSR